MNKVIFLSFIGLLVIAGLSCPARAQTSPIAPNGIIYLSEADTLTVNKTYNITVQILYDGGQLKSEGVRVYIEASDISIIPAELGTYVLTDKNGVANYTVIPGKTGDVKLTANAMSTNSGVSASKKFHVIEGPIATPTPTPTPSPSPSPTPTPTATPTEAPTTTIAPISPPPSGDANAQAAGIIAAGIALAIVLIACIIIVRSFRKK